MRIKRLKDICNALLLGVTVNEDPCNWNTQFENMLSKASSRLYILRVCKYYGYSLQELTLLFDSLIMSLFTYAIEVWVLWKISLPNR